MGLNPFIVSPPSDTGFAGQLLGTVLVEPIMLVDIGEETQLVSVVMKLKLSAIKGKPWASHSQEGAGLLGLVA
jgi:hypothetical protein